VRYLDDVIGELLEELDSLGLHDTLTVVNSDHGEGLGDRGPDDHGHGIEMFNTRLAVPLIFHHPGLPLAGIRLDEPVENIDILPTVLELLGLSWSDDEIDGRSLAPSILQGKEPARRPEYVAETGYKGERRSAILSGEWKLILDHRLQQEGSGAGIQLYSAYTDPRELNEVSRRHPGEVDRLTRGLVAWKEERERRRSEAPSRDQLSPGEIEALRILGYLDESDESPAASESRAVE